MPPFKVLKIFPRLVVKNPIEELIKSIDVILPEADVVISVHVSPWSILFKSTPFLPPQKALSPIISIAFKSFGGIQL